MAITNPPYVAWRDGRPRFVPGTRERALGFKGRDLRHADGRWFTYEEASAWAAGNLEGIQRARAGETGRAAPSEAGRCMEDLLRDWLARGARVRPRTLDGYRKQVDAVIFKPQTRRDRRAGQDRQREDIATAPVEAIGKPELRGFFDYQKRTRGHHAALASIAVISAAWTWGCEDTRWRLPRNPRLDMEFERPAPRIVVWSGAEIGAMVATADRMGVPSIGDSVLLGLMTGQRQNDRLAMIDEGLQNGRRIFRQSKTGAVVAIKETVELAERLAQARARTAALALRTGNRPATILVHEATGAAFNESTYRHIFDDVRAAAARHCPSLAGKRDQDLRDTCVTWMALGEATLGEIASVTGHSLPSIHQIMKHYLALSPQMGDAAIDKMRARMIREGIDLSDAAIEKVRDQMDRDLRAASAP